MRGLDLRTRGSWAAVLGRRGLDPFSPNFVRIGMFIPNFVRWTGRRAQPIHTQSAASRTTGSLAQIPAMFPQGSSVRQLSQSNMPLRSNFMAQRSFSTRRTLEDVVGPIGAFLRDPQPSTTSLRAALKAYPEVAARETPETAAVLLDEILARYAAGGRSVALTNQTLLEFFTATPTPPSTPAVITVLAAYTARSPANVVPEPIAMIPFRRAIYRADFSGALELMDALYGTRSNFRHIARRRLLRFGLIWVAVVGSVLVGAYHVLTSPGEYLGRWEPSTATMICVMLGTYLAALTLYGTMTAAGSRSGLGLVLEWLPGTSPWQRYLKSEQVRMATFVAELNRSLPENLGELAPQLLQDLRGLELKPVETRAEAYLKEYWARGGAGFEWTEPDQDPSEVLWMRHMEASRPSRLGSAYSRRDAEGKLLSWADEVEREKQGLSIPHASLLGVDEMRGELSSEQGQRDFEAELAEDMRQIRLNQLREQEQEAAAIEGEQAEVEGSSAPSELNEFSESNKASESSESGESHESGETHESKNGDSDTPTKSK